MQKTLYQAKKNKKLKTNKPVKISHSVYFNTFSYYSKVKNKLF